MLPRPAIFLPRRKSLVRAILLALAALATTLRLAGFPDISALHGSRWQLVPVLLAVLAIAETARCLERRWSLYHAGVLILLYTDLMILAMTVFLWLYL